jgi:uncharacterized damage-inducible protein DinB
MINFWKTIVWPQFGASIEMLENAMRACPEDLWADRAQKPEFWYVAFHTLFFLDFYLSETEKGFTPPAPYNLDELDPAGLMPPYPYSKSELLAYLDHGRKKCRTVIEELTDQKADQRCGFEWLDLSVGELLLYNMRHVQHHAAQLNLILRQKTDSAPRWIRTATAG